MSVQVQEIPPAKELIPYVEGYKQGTFNTEALSLLSQKVIPHGYIDLIIHLSDHHCELVFDEGWRYSPDFTLIGLWTQSYHVRFRNKVDVFWVRFKPEGLYALFGVPSSEFGNSQAAIEDILGITFRDFCDRVREATKVDERIQLANFYFQKQLLKHSKNFRNYVQVAAELIRNENYQLTLEQLSDSVCISPRQLEREFKAKIGVSPKKYMQIARLSQVHRLLGEGRAINFTEISYRCGYADQAHFIRDFKAFTGEVPTGFLNERDQFIVSPSLVAV